MGVRVTSECDSLNTLTICDVNKTQLNAAIAFNDENYIAVWSDERFGSSWYYRVVAARITTAGVVLDTGICLGNGGEQREFRPDIAYDGNRCLVVWYHDLTPYGVYGRFVNNSCQPEDSIITIAQTAYYSSINPRIAFDGTNYLVVFNDKPGNYYNIYGQIVSPEGNLIGSKILIATDGINQRYPDVIWDNHFYVIVWGEGLSGIKGQRVDADGHCINSSFQISNNTPYTRYQPSIAVSDTNYLVVWCENRDTQHDIYGNIDQTIGIKENEPKHVSQAYLGPTIFSGPLKLPKGKTCKVFDITGRAVMPHHIKPGVYFIGIDGNITHKVVKIR